MKTKQLLSAALLSCISATIVAQTLEQNFAKQLSDAAQKARVNKLAVEYKDDFLEKLNQIASDAKCVDPTRRDMFACRGTTPQMIEAAKPKLEKWGKDLDAAVTTVGGKTLQDVYKPKLAELDKKIQAGKIDGPEAKPLRDRIVNFFQRNTKRPTLAQTEEDYQKLAADIDAAVKLSAESDSTKAFMVQYQEKLKAVEDKIARSKLNPVVRTDLQGDLRTLTAPVLGGSAGGKTGSPSSAKRTPTEMAKANADLKAFDARVDQTILADGSKSFRDLATPKLDALAAKLRDAKIDPADSRALQTRVDALRKEIGAVTGDASKGGAAGVGGASGRAGAMTLDMFDSQVAKLSMDIDAAIALNANRGKANTVLDAFTNKWKVVDTKIARSRLNDLFLRDFDRKADDIMAGVGCGTGSPSGKAGTACDPKRVDMTKLADADKRLDALSIAVDKAIAEYGAKSLTDIYRPKADEARMKLMGSNVVSSDKMKLDLRLRDFIMSLEGKGRVPLTPEVIQKNFLAIVGDIDAAIRLSGPASPGK